MKKSELVFNKPVYIGVSILDLAKTLVVDYHYNFFKKLKYVEKIELIYTDTDSLIYLIHCEDLYAVIKEYNEKFFDTSDYPTNNLYGIVQINGKKLGYIKDEMKGFIVFETVCLRPKMYSIKMDDENLEEFKKAKGIARSVLKDVRHDNFKRFLFDKKKKYISFNSIQSKNHEVFSFKLNKTLFDGEDNKRIFLENFTSYPIGYDFD